MKKVKKPKEKVIYYDDGSTISDMSLLRKKKPNTNDNRINTLQGKPRATEREKLHTFFTTFKMMLAPTGIVLLIIFILYIICRLIFR